MTDWYSSWFESPWYLRLYQHRTEVEAREAVNLVREISLLPRRAKILDLACGYGRHAMALAEAGYLVVGLDASEFLIEHARTNLDHDNVSYVVGDMRHAYPEGPYDAVVNFFTSFGYFEADADNGSVLGSVFKSLKPGGTFILDFLNESWVRSTLVPETMSRVPGAFVIQERRIEEPFVVKDITIISGCSGDEVFQERVRLYTPAELQGLITEHGFMIDRLCGNYDASPFVELTSPRCIIISHRPSS